MIDVIATVIFYAVAILLAIGICDFIGWLRGIEID